MNTSQMAIQQQEGQDITGHSQIQPKGETNQMERADIIGNCWRKHRSGKINRRRAILDNPPKSSCPCNAYADEY